MIGNDAITHLKFKRILYDDDTDDRHYEIILSCDGKYDPIQCLLDYLHTKGVYYQTHMYKVAFACTETVNLWSMLKFVMDGSFEIVRLSNILYTKLLHTLLFMTSHSFDLYKVNNNTLITKYIALYENKEVNREVKHVETLKTNSLFANVTVPINIVDPNKINSDGKEKDEKTKDESTYSDAKTPDAKLSETKTPDVKPYDKCVCPEPIEPNKPEPIVVPQYTIHYGEVKVKIFDGASNNKCVYPAPIEPRKQEPVDIPRYVGNMPTDESTSSDVKHSNTKTPETKSSDVKPDANQHKSDDTWYTEDDPNYNPYARAFMQRMWGGNPDAKSDDEYTEYFNNECDNIPEKVTTKSDTSDAKSPEVKPSESKSSDKDAQAYPFKPKDGDIIKVPHYEVNVISDGKRYEASISGYDVSKQADAFTSAKIYCRTSPSQKAKISVDDQLRDLRITENQFKGPDSFHKNKLESDFTAEKKAWFWSKGKEETAVKSYGMYSINACPNAHSPH